MEEAILEILKKDYSRIKASKETADMFEKFTDWCIKNVSQIHPTGKYVDIETNKEYLFISELFTYWNTNFNK